MSKSGKSEVGSLTLKRKKGESITIDGCIKVQVHDVSGGYVWLKISAPLAIPIVRDELLPVET